MGREIKNCRTKGLAWYRFLIYIRTQFSLVKLFSLILQILPSADLGSNFLNVYFLNYPTHRISAQSQHIPADREAKIVLSDDRSKLGPPLPPTCSRLGTPLSPKSDIPGGLEAYGHDRSERHTTLP